MSGRNDTSFAIYRSSNDTLGFIVPEFQLLNKRTLSTCTYLLITQ